MLGARLGPATRRGGVHTAQRAHQGTHGRVLARPRAMASGLVERADPAARRSGVKLVVFGLSFSSSWGNGQATTWRALARGLAKRGHRLVFFERDVPYYARQRDMHDVPGGRLALYRDWASVEPAARAELADADAAMVTSFCPDGPSAAELVLESRVYARAFYDMDTPVTLSRLEAGQGVPYLPAGGLGAFDVVLSFAGGESMDELERRLGARRVEALYGCVDPEVHRPVAAREDLIADMSYLGTYAADRHDGVEALLFAPARATPSMRFLVVGALYPSSCAFPPNTRHLEHLPPSAHAELYCSSRLTLNVTRSPMRERGSCPSGRLFEAAACGAPTLSDAWKGLDEFFEPGREILVASRSEEAMEHLRASPESLASVADAARRRVLDQHTGTHRADELVQILERARRPSAAAPRDSGADPRGT